MPNEFTSILALDVSVDDGVPEVAQLSTSLERSGEFIMSAKVVGVPDARDQLGLSIKYDNLGMTAMCRKDDEAWRLSEVAERNVEQCPFEPDETIVLLRRYTFERNETVFPAKGIMIWLSPDQ